VVYFQMDDWKSQLSWISLVLTQFKYTVYSNTHVFSSSQIQSVHEVVDKCELQVFSARISTTIAGSCAIVRTKHSN
jgi:hypothetical protein